MSTERDPPESDRPFGIDEPLVGPRGDLESPGAPGAEVAPAASEPAPVSETEGVSAQTPPPAQELTSPAEERPRRHAQSPNMLPARERRRSLLERLVVRLIATCGIVAIGVAIAAIMVSSKSQGWVVGLVVSIVTVVLAGLLWSSRSL